MPAAPTCALGAHWRAVEQPDLQQALEAAPLLEPELLGAPARGVNVWEHWMVPNPDGKSWDVLQVYFKEYYGPTWLYVVDLGTGQVRNQRLPDGHQFYLSGRALGLDGRYYIATPSRQTGSMDLFVYDPATNVMEERGEIVHGLSGELRPLAVGPDGRIYGSGTRGRQVGLYIYDPRLGKVVRDFGPVGPIHPNGAWSRDVVGVDDTHAYVASGMIPAWSLVAVNLQTGEEKVILESPTDRRMDIIEQFPGARASVQQGGGVPAKEYWLYHGSAIPKVDDKPPWPPQASPWDKAAPNPEVYFGQIDPDADGRARLWYRPKGGAPRDETDRGPGQGPGQRVGAQVAGLEAGGWNSVPLENVPAYPHRINPLSVLPDGRIYGTGDDYTGTFLFDPKTNRTTYCGPRAGLSPYTTIVYGDRLYSSGYPVGALFVYEPRNPWTMGLGGPPDRPALNPDDSAGNPHRIGDFGSSTHVAVMESSALGADGNIYFGGFGEREYTGGGLGWFDPKSGSLDGLWKPLSGYAVHAIAPARNGRLIVISTATAADVLMDNRTPEDARLFIYDVTERKIVRDIVPVPKARATGLVIEASRGRLLGLTTAKAGSGGTLAALLYGVDVATGKVLFRKPLPWPVGTDPYWPHWVDPSYEHQAFVRGPDGFIWTWFRDVLVRIDPGDASVHVVGKIDPPGWPTFVGPDVYLSGHEQLRRLRNIAGGK